MHEATLKLNIQGNIVTVHAIIDDIEQTGHFDSICLQNNLIKSLLIVKKNT